MTTTTLKVQIQTNRPTTGRIDASLGSWSYITGAVLVDGVQVAHTAVQNWAGGGFDMGLGTETDHPAAKRACKAMGWPPTHRGDSLRQIAEWIKRHPEAMAPQRAWKDGRVNKWIYVRDHSLREFVRVAKWVCRSYQGLDRVLFDQKVEEHVSIARSKSLAAIRLAPI